MVWVFGDTALLLLLIEYILSFFCVDLDPTEVFQGNNYCGKQNMVMGKLQYLDLLIIYFVHSGKKHLCNQRRFMLPSE